MYSSCFPVSFLGSPLQSTATASSSSKEGATNRSRRWNLSFDRPSDPSEETWDVGNESLRETGLGRTRINNNAVTPAPVRTTSGTHWWGTSSSGTRTARPPAWCCSQAAPPREAPLLRWRRNGAAPFRAEEIRDPRRRCRRSLSAGTKRWASLAAGSRFAALARTGTPAGSTLPENGD